MDIFVIGGGGLSKVLISVLKKTPSLNIVGYVDIVDKGKILAIPQALTRRKPNYRRKL